MKNFLELCYFEQKKIFKKTYVQIAFLSIAVVTLFINIYPLFLKNKIAYVDKNGAIIIDEVTYFEEIQLTRKFAKQYNGKKLTNEVALEIRKFNETYLSKTEQEDGGYIPLLNTRLPCRSLYNLGISPYAELENLADFAYQTMFDSQEQYLQSLSKEEMNYWLQERETIEVPFTMYYTNGYYHILARGYWLNIIGLLFVVLCLCSSFSEENACNTDAIVRASRFGKMKLSLAKLVAGEMIACITILGLFGITAIVQLGVHGITGAKAPIQIQECLKEGFFYRCSELTMGNACLIIFIVSLLLALLIGAITMLFSKLCLHSIPAIVIPFCVFLVPFVFEEPRDMLRTQIFSYFPFQRLEVEEFLTDGRMVKVFGNLLTATQTSLLLYGGLLVLSLGICVMICKATVQKRK